MKTSRRKYNEQYRDEHLYIDGFHNPKIVEHCNEHKRCEECRSHLELVGGSSIDDGWLNIYSCPTCGKSYGVPEYFDECGDIDRYPMFVLKNLERIFNKRMTSKQTIKEFALNVGVSEEIIRQSEEKIPSISREAYNELATYFGLEEWKESDHE